MSEVPPEDTDEPSGAGEAADQPLPATDPIAEPAGPFDSLFAELGNPEPREVAPPWHAAWERQGPADAHPSPSGNIQRPDDAPFASAGASAAGSIYHPGQYLPVPYQQEAAPPRRRRSLARPAGRLARELAETVVLALAIFLLVRAVVQNFQVEGRSMEPTLETGWYLLVNKSLYWEVNLDTVGKFVPFVDGGTDPTRYIFRAPKRGDVVVFQQPDQPIGAAERDFIKRIIGLPGEVVEVHDGTVFIDGKPLHEPYISEKPAYDCRPVLVPEGSYFVLGDNRNNSSDSHTWGPVPKGNIIGQAWLVYWPFETFGLVDNEHAKPDAAQQEPSVPNKEEVPLLARGGCSGG